MEHDEKLKKIDAGYLFLNIFGPAAALILGMALVVVLPDRAGMLVCVGLYILAILWWAILERKLYNRIKANTLAGLASEGFVANYTFNADGCTVAADLRHGRVAILFRWNPRRVYVRPACALSEVRVDNGRRGAGILTGSSRVSFLFSVDGITIRVNTFTSNRRWQMESDYITTGVQKAEDMTKALIAAGARAKGCA